jgi:hypothetical protein
MTVTNWAALAPGTPADLVPVGYGISGNLFVPAGDAGLVPDIRDGATLTQEFSGFELSHPRIEG